MTRAQRFARLKAKAGVYPMSKQPHDVTIYPIYDAVHRPGPTDRFVGCLDSAHAFSDELPPGSYVHSLREALDEELIDLKPGHYLMLEFNEDIEDYLGLVFMVTEDGGIIAGCGDSSVPMLATWPPRKRTV